MDHRTHDNRPKERQPYDRKHDDRTRNDKYGPSRRSEVDADRWTRGGHTAQRGRGSSRARSHQQRSEADSAPVARRSPLRTAATEEEHVDIVTPNHVPSNQNKTPTKTNEELMLIIHIELENGTLAQLNVHADEDVHLLARDFSNQHMIDNELVDLLVQEIQQHLEDMTV